MSENAFHSLRYMCIGLQDEVQPSVAEVPTTASTTSPISPQVLIFIIFFHPTQFSHFELRVFNCFCIGLQADVQPSVVEVPTPAPTASPITPQVLIFNIFFHPFSFHNLSYVYLIVCVLVCRCRVPLQVPRRPLHLYKLASAVFLFLRSCGTSLMY